MIQWLDSNKIPLNVAKTEVIIFRRKKKQLDFDLNLKIYAKKFQASSYLKYLGIYLDEYLDCSPHIEHLSQKLVNANAMLFKLVTIWMKLLFNHFIMLFSFASFICLYCMESESEP